MILRWRYGGLFIGVRREKGFLFSRYGTKKRIFVRISNRKRREKKEPKLCLIKIRLAWALVAIRSRSKPPNICYSMPQFNWNPVGHCIELMGQFGMSNHAKNIPKLHPFVKIFLGSWIVHESHSGYVLSPICFQFSSFYPVNWALCINTDLPYKRYKEALILKELR